MQIKTRSLRQRVWFNTLSKVERAIVDLTIKCVERVRSNILARTVSTIVKKLLKCLDEGFMTRAEKVGYAIAEKICTLGESWGNETCSTWKYEKSFSRFLGVNALNT